MMRPNPSRSSPASRLILFLAAAVLPTTAGAVWQVVVSEQGKRIEIDRATIVTTPNDDATIVGRIVLERPIVDPKTSATYRIIEVTARYDCKARTHSTLKRSYFKEEGELLRQEEVKLPFDMPVRTGSPEDKVLREVCRPKPGTPSVELAGKVADKVGEAAGALRRENEALVEREVKKELAAVLRSAPPHKPPPPAAARRGSTAREVPAKGGGAWSYENAESWGQLSAAYAGCANGRQQSPIDLREAIAVDLEAIEFAYRPAPFRVVDSGRGLQMSVYGGGLSLLGKTYALTRIDFHRPSEFAIDGKSFDMEAQLIHRADDGKLAIVVVLLESGSENPLIQTALNNLPLERGGEVAPPAQSVDVTGLLPGDRRYFAFMGSLTTPPCTEEVLWLVLKKPQPVSAEQLSIFRRLYRPNARPLQPSFGRIIKESR